MDKEPVTLSGLARRLVANGVLDEEKARTTYLESVENGVSYISHLLTDKTLDGYGIAVAASQEFGVPLFNITATELEPEVINLVNQDLIQRHNILPLYKRGGRLFVAVSDPTNLQALDEIKFHTGLNIEPVLTAHDILQVIIGKTLDGAADSLGDLDDDDLSELETEAESDQNVQEDSEADINDTPVVRFVNKIMLDAIKRGASDIHFEPYETTYRVRQRLDGILQEVAHPPVNLGSRLTARIKVMAQLDVSERRIPQDGRIKLKLSKKRAVDFRVSTCPTLFGEKVVMRVLDPMASHLGIDSLGFDEEQKELFNSAIRQPNGMVLVTGPTGSGKTATLYTALNILNTEDTNICTAEDPAEINMPGINQVNINTKTGLTFASALRSFLRQDPDVIMVGEIRDLETAEIGIKAAQTGHLVLSTLHTNDAPKTLTRLLNMGVASYNIASTISLIIAQRLVRRLCEHCKEPEELPREALLKEGFSEEQVNDITVYRPVGCNKCNNGYKGRLGIFQIMPISEAMGRLIMKGGDAMQIADQAATENIPDLRGAGLKKVILGETSLEEVNRVTKE
ncbi:MAG TPA: type IV-A pilus assembly ATPase PilB [Gammaproteobacteria bacterium]|nr:type IV-A pilus assembly ATPase PilB [Gammaproteobacteria bacterium]